MDKGYGFVRETGRLQPMVRLMVMTQDIKIRKVLPLWRIIHII